MITTVTLNPAIDRTVFVETLESGTVNRVLNSREDMGGKGINVARTLQILGSKVLATGFIGSCNLIKTKRLLACEHFDTRFIEIDANTRQNIKLVENQTGVTTDINESGFAVESADLQSLYQLIDEFAKKSSWLVVSGSVPPGLPETIYRDLIRRAPSSCRTVLDADGIWLRNGLASSPYLIKPNVCELENALGRKLFNTEAIVAAAREIITGFGVTLVLVSRGCDGSVLVTKDQALQTDALPVCVVNTVGAGDSLLAGFIHALETGRTLQEALAVANACGSLACVQAGTGSISRSEADRLSGQVKIRELDPF